MRRSQSWFVVSATLLLHACGVQEQELAESEAALADTCSASVLDWPAGATDTQKVCSGPWEYADRCCDKGAAGCKHAHAVGTHQVTETQRGSGCTRTCILWDHELNRCGEYTPWTCTSAPACNTSSAFAQNAFAAVNGARSGCKLPDGTGAATLTVTTGGWSLVGGYVQRTCTARVTNAPYSDDGTKLPQCNAFADSVVCKPIYARCVGSTTDASGNTGVVNRDGTNERQMASASCAAPSGGHCCAKGATACKHTHAVGTHQVTETQRGSGCTRTCILWDPEVNRCGEYTPWTCTSAPACNTSSAFAQNALAAVSGARSGCQLPGGTGAATLTVTTGGWSLVGGYVQRTCTANVTNAPYSHDGTTLLQCNALADAMVCGTSPTYAACSGPVSGGTTGVTNSDGTAESEVAASYCTLPLVHTAPGKSRASLSSEPVPPSSTTYAAAPSCTTCEGDSTVTPPSATEVQGKFGCIQNRLSTAPADGWGRDPDLQKKLVQRGKLVFEYYGNLLTSPGQTTQAEQLYTARPSSWQPACSQLPDWSVPTGATGCGTGLTAAEGSLVLCDRLLDSHVPLAIAEMEAGFCVDAWASVNAVPPNCTTRPQLVSGYAQTSTELLRRAFSLIPTPTADPSGRAAKLRNHMQIAERWYQNIEATGEDRQVRFRDAEIVAGSIVQSAIMHRRDELDGLTSATDPTQLSRRDDLVQANAADAQEVLGALLPTASTAPLTNTPALYVLAHALQPQVDRLHEVDFLHDLGCRFRTCGTGLATKVTQMHGLIEAMPDSTALGTAPSMLQTAGWQDFFDRLHSNHAQVFQGAIMDAMDASVYAPSLVTTATELDGPVWAVAGIVRASSTKAEHYAQTGRLRPGDANALFTGLTSNKLDDAMTLVSTVQAALQSDHAAYDANWVAYIDAEVAVDTSQERIHNATDELQIRHEALSQVAERIDGLRVAATVDRERFGDFAKQYEDMVRALEAYPGEYVQRTASPMMAITPAHARYQSAFTNVTSVAVLQGGTPWTMTVTSDDLVRIEATGQWSPTCAVDAHATSQPTGLPAHIQSLLGRFRFRPALDGYTGAMTGPQGFGVTTSSSTYSGHTTSEAEFNAWNYAGGMGSAAGTIIGAYVSVGAGASVGGSVGGLVGGLIAGLFGNDEQSSTTSGSETRTTAVFNAGLRVNTTPYPEYPAGALLAVKWDPAASSVVDVEVVQAPYTSLVIERGAGGASRTMQIYLVVNDTTCNRASSVGQLAVQVVRLTPIAGYAQVVQPAMASTYRYVQDRVRTTILPQGTVLPSDLGTIRQQALLYLEQACAYCDLTTLESNVMPFYSAWIDTELNQAERQVEIAKLEKQVKILAMEFDALARQVDGFQRQAQLLSLLPAWSANNIDEMSLRAKTRELAEVIDRYLVPFSRAKYPEVLTGAPGFPGFNSTPDVFNPITVNLDWDAEYGTLAFQLVNIVEQVRTKFLSARTHFDRIDPGTGGPVTQVVAVAIPKPTWMWTENMIISDLYAGQNRALGPTESEAVWTAIAGGLAAEIHIPPEALYRAATEGAVPGQLACTQVVPVIQSMAIFAADANLSSNSALNSQAGHSVTTHSSQNVLYGTASGPVSFLASMPGWLNYQTPIIYGMESSAYSFYTGNNCTDNACPVVNPSTLGAGQGLSPFGEITLGVDPAHLDRTDVYALILMMTVEYRDNTSGVAPAWIQRCQ